jgi:broad specificity phosphatase PhoE
MIDVQKRALRLYLVRHGETAENRKMRYLGTQDALLTPNGMKQALQVAEALSQIPIKIIFSSPMRRTADTAARIQAACKAELCMDARLKEGSFGSWEGLTRAEVIERGDQDRKNLALWEADPSIAPPGGESIENIQKRMISLADELYGEFSGSSVVLVSHVGPIKALLAAVLGAPLQTSRRLFLDPCTISVVEWGSQPLLRLLNSHAHLGWPSARWMVEQS